MHERWFAASFCGQGAMPMWGKGAVSRTLSVAAAILISSCTTTPGQPEHIFGVWGGAHAGAVFQGGLADVQFDCASGTIDDPVYPAPDGSFSVKGTYRTGA